MRVFADTSALLKRYVAEPGTDEVSDVLGRTTELVVGCLTVVEAISALSRRGRAEELTEEDLWGARADLLEDLADAEWVPVDAELVATAVELVERRRLRTLDALQLGSALVSRPALFLCADRALARAAVAEGLPTQIPG